MPMGAGKTTGIISYMNAHPEQQYLFITPYRKERRRIKESCERLDFAIPDNQYSRLNECNSFIEQGRNIATTHALFSLFNQDTIDKLAKQHYTLIIDEEPDSIFNVFHISIHDFQMLENNKYFSVDERNCLVISEDRTYDGAIESIKMLYSIKDSRVFYLVDDWNYDNESVGIVSVMRPDIFHTFDKVLVLTYLFKDSNYDCYCRFFRFSYEYLHFENDTLRAGLFDDKEFIRKVKNLIQLYEGNLNFRHRKGNNTNAMSLTKSWYENANSIKLQRVKNNIYNFVRHIVNSPSSDIMWSVYKNYIDAIKGNGYTNGYVPCNCRATNEYRDKKTLAYLLNLYPDPFLIRWLSHNDIRVNPNHFPLTMLLQWVFRSQIRDGQPIQLYLPAARIRDILQDYFALAD